MAAKFTLPSKVRSNSLGKTIQELKTLHESLSKIEQDDFATLKADLDPVASRLVDSELVNNGDKSVRLLVACCFANILRLYAPDAPYSSEQIHEIFKLFIVQLKCLADEKNSYLGYVFYLVESLATVKSIVLIFDVEETERNKLIRQLFSLTFDLTPVAHVPKTAKLYLLEIAQALIEESDSIPSEIISLLLQKANDVREETKNFVHELIQLTADKLQPALALHFNEKVLSFTAASTTASAEDKGGVGKKMEMIRLLHSQITNIGIAAPNALISVIPQLEDELQTSDAELRMIAISSIARLITECHQVIIKLYPSLFTSWLPKMNDKVVNVRIFWIKNALNMLCTLPAEYSMLKQELTDSLCEKLQDVDAKVREKTISLLNSEIDKDLSTFKMTEPILNEVYSRCRDKMLSVREAALHLLSCFIKKTHLTDPNSSLFATAVNHLFSLIYTNDRSLRLSYEYFIEESFLVPNKTEYSNYVNLFIGIFSKLNEDSIKACHKVFADKSLFVKYVSGYLTIVSKSPEDPRMGPLISHLSNLFINPMEAVPFLKSLAFIIHKMEHVKTALVSLTSIDEKLNTRFKAMEHLNSLKWQDFDKRIDPNLMKYLINRCSLLFFCSEFVSTALTSEKEKENEVYKTAQRLISVLISEFPSLGLRHSNVMEEEILSNPSEDILLNYCKFVESFQGQVAPNEAVISLLHQIVSDSCVEEKKYKYAFRALACFPSEQEQCQSFAFNSWSQLCQNPFNPRAWVIIAEAAKTSLCTDMVTWEEKLETCLKMCHTDSLVGGEKEDEIVMNTVLAIRALRRWISNLKHVDREEEMNQLKIFAPLLVKHLDLIDNARIKVSICKTLLLFVPRPTASTLLLNMAPLLNVTQILSDNFGAKLCTTVMKQYQNGNIGMIYVCLIFLLNSSPSFTTKSISSFKSTIHNLRLNDRFADAVLPLDSSRIEINSKAVRRYEDVYILTIILAALLPNVDHLESTLLGRYEKLVELLNDSLVTEINISFLFDAVVQLKRCEFGGDSIHSRNRHLYILSELCQNYLRKMANSHKWALRSIKSIIVISEDLIKEIEDQEEASKTMKKTYLLKAQEKIISKSKRREISKTTEMDIDYEEEDENNSKIVNLQNVKGSTSTSSSNVGTPKKRDVGRRSDRLRQKEEAQLPSVELD